MRTIRIGRAGTLAIVSALSLGTGLAAAAPSDGYADQQDYAKMELTTTLDPCVTATVWGALVAGDHLKNPIRGGAPSPWSDITIVMHLRDDCAGTTTELSGWVVAPPEIVRLQSASVDGIVVPISDASGELEVDVTVSLDWTIAGPATSVRYRDPSNGYFREERNAPATVVGAVSVSDADGDVWPAGFSLTESEVVNANIGFANEIALSLP